LYLYQDTDLGSHTWALDIGQWAGASDFSCGVDATTGKILSSCIQGANALALTKGQIFTHNATVDSAHAIGTDGQLLGYLASNADGLANYDAMSVTITSEAQGDILIRGASGWINLGKGNEGYILTTHTSGNSTWSAAPVSTTLTTKGDLQGFSTVNARVPVGTDGFLLQADSAAAAGVSYVARTVSICGSVSVTPNASIATHATQITTVTGITGVLNNDPCVCSERVQWNADLILKVCRGSATGSIDVALHNDSGATITSAAAQTMDYCCFH
jgi:hypothetical protein